MSAKPSMSDDMAHEAWKTMWSNWLVKEDEPVTDPERPWVDIFGDEPISITRESGRIWYHRPHAHGHDAVIWLWTNGTWIDTVNDRLPDDVEVPYELLDMNAGIEIL